MTLFGKEIWTTIMLMLTGRNPAEDPIVFDEARWTREVWDTTSMGYGMLCWWDLFDLTIAPDEMARDSRLVGRELQAFRARLDLWNKGAGIDLLVLLGKMGLAMCNNRSRRNTRQPGWARQPCDIMMSGQLVSKCMLSLAVRAMQPHGVSISIQGSELARVTMAKDQDLELLHPPMCQL